MFAPAVSHAALPLVWFIQVNMNSLDILLSYQSHILLAYSKCPVRYGRTEARQNKLVVMEMVGLQDYGMRVLGHKRTHTENRS